MNLTITPKPLSGSITPPASKSQAHRLLIAAALAKGKSTIYGLSFSEDIKATIRCMTALGAVFHRVDETTVTVEGIPQKQQLSSLPLLDCGESGSTLRFLIPIALAVCGGARFTGGGRLMERPQTPYFDLFTEKNIFFEIQDGVLTVKGHLTTGDYALPGNVSSQFFTGLLFALSLLEEDSTLVSTTELESEGYLTITQEAQKSFGVTIHRDSHGGYTIPGGQAYLPTDITVEGDWSQAGFWYAAKVLGNDLTICGMQDASSQGDRAVLDLLPLFSTEQTRTLDLKNIPDLAPPLAAMAAGTKGRTAFVNAARLRIKESDRIEAICKTLTAFGVSCFSTKDAFTVDGCQTFSPISPIDCHNDHRIAMMAAILSTHSTAPVTLLGAECVNKSYPTFWEEFQRLGGNIHVL